MEKIVTLENIISSLLLLYKQKLNCKEIISFMGEFFSKHPEFTYSGGSLTTLDLFINNDGITISLKDGLSLQSSLPNSNLQKDDYTIEKRLYFLTGSIMYDYTYFKVHKIKQEEREKYMYLTPYEQKAEELYKNNKNCEKKDLDIDQISAERQLIKTYKEVNN